MRARGQHGPGGGRVDEGPGTLAVAFSCVALSAVPCVMAAGVAQDSVGVVRGTLTTSVVEAVAVGVVASRRSA